MDKTEMTGREIIRRVLEFDDPPRIGFIYDDGRINDTVPAYLEPNPNFDDQRHTTQDGVERWRDEWGCTWQRLDAFSKGEVAEGPIKAWSDLESYEPPLMLEPERYEGSRRRLAAHPDKYPLAWLRGFPFAIARKLRTFEQYLLDVVAEPENVRRLNGVVRDVLRKHIELFGDMGCKGVGFGEDWGTQERLLINPAQWRAIFRPDFEVLCEAAHARGMTVWMHSCGYIADIIDDLIEIGINVLQFDQPAIYGIDFLAERYGGRVAFWTPVDIQKTLQSGDRTLIRAQAKALVENLGRGGGFIAKNYGNLDAINVKREWDEWAYEAFLEFGGGA